MLYYCQVLVCVVIVMNFNIGCLNDVGARVRVRVRVSVRVRVAYFELGFIF